MPGARLQIEFYFSDANLPTDKKLLKQIKKDPEGYGESAAAVCCATHLSAPQAQPSCYIVQQHFNSCSCSCHIAIACAAAAASGRPNLGRSRPVPHTQNRVSVLWNILYLSDTSVVPAFPHPFAVPTKLFANFRKVRALSKDVELIVQALRHSTALELSADGKRVKRVQTVPEYDVSDIQRRTVVVENLPVSPTIESVTDMFRQYGTVKLVRICSKESKGKLPSWLTVRPRTALLRVPQSCTEPVRSATRLAKHTDELPATAKVWS